MRTRTRPARIGILGGMGPAATADFYAKLVHATPALRDQDHIPVLMDADPTIPDRAMSYLRNGPSPLDDLRRAARSLQAGGAELIVMPCNTAHLWYDPVSREVNVPFLHIVDAVVEELARLTPRAAALRVGLLATGATLAGRLYPRRAALHPVASGWHWIEPDAETQHEQVEQGIAAVKAGDLPRGQAAIHRGLSHLRQQGVDAVVYACTEVPLALAGHDTGGTVGVDSTAALARLCVRHALRADPVREST